jgi:RimJ/RimL family protein N-acetyltransferase
MESHPLPRLPIPIGTERLVLRELTLDDAAFMLDLLNDADFLGYIGDRGVRTLDDARQYIANGSIASYAQHGFGFWAVLPKGTETCIGICGLARRESLEDVDIGYAFLPAWRGQGYALEASHAVMQLAREHIGLTRIVAITALENPASARLLEKIGLRFERLIRPHADAQELRLFAWNA